MHPWVLDRAFGILNYLGAILIVLAEHASKKCPVVPVCVVLGSIPAQRIRLRK